MWVLDTNTVIYFFKGEGWPIGPYDTLIAGTALAHGAILVSRNVREFGRVDSLRVENWY